ncbi:MAG: glycosyltransferase family 2 protein [Verrucomicrobia bacterium]|nr:glycosyltransferase family 2 protein [Verrucomicrobiota bacterium]
MPCFNEARTIAPLVAEARQIAKEIIVVDDGSTDDTRGRAKQAGACVLRHSQNRGKGAALRTGLIHAHQRGFSWAITLDGDGQHRPGNIPLFLECADRTAAALVIGNRFHNARALPWLRRWVNRWISRQLSARAGRPLPDTQCGFRLIYLKTWAVLEHAANHFEVESEMLLSFLAAGHRVEFVPIEVIGRGPRRSRIQPLVDSWRWWKWWRHIPQIQPAPADSLKTP